MGIILGNGEKWRRSCQPLLNKMGGNLSCPVGTIGRNMLCEEWFHQVITTNPRAANARTTGLVLALLVLKRDFPLYQVAS